MKIKILCIFRFLFLFYKEKDGNTLEATLRQPKVLIMNTMMEILAPIEDFEIASNIYFTFC